MIFKSTSTGGRLMVADTPFGAARVEWAADGHLISESIEIREPAQAAKPDPAPSHGPGTLLKRAIKAVTGEDPSPNCACNRRMQTMNAWGWWGCWKRRREIAGWLAEEAAKRGHDVDPDKALTLLKAAWRESRAIRPPSPPQP